MHPKKVAINDALPCKATRPHANANLVFLGPQHTNDGTGQIPLLYHQTELTCQKLLAQIFEVNPQILQHFLSPISPCYLAKFGWHAFSDHS